MRYWIAFGVCGLFVGWMVGLSVSPVAGTVLSAVITMVITAAAVTAGLKSDDSDDDAWAKISKRFKAGPIVALIVGLAVGATTGVYARTHEWLGDSSESGEGKDDGADVPEHKVPGLWAVTANECADLKAAEDSELATVFDRLEDDELRALAKEYEATCLRAIVRAVCK
jgi:hypothetical protein